MSTQAKVDTPTPQYNEMKKYWEMVDALRGGTETMRAAGETYLPQEPKESDEAYNNRLRKSVLYNATNRTIETLAGKPFTKPITLKEDVPPDVVEWAENFDMRGSSVDDFALEVFDTALAYGLTHMLIDYPIVDAKLTLADEMKIKIRPYALHIKPQQIIGWRTKIVNGFEVLSQIRILETVEEDDGEFGSKLVERIRVITPGAQAIYVKRENGFVLESEVRTTLQEIPLVTLYTKRTGTLTGKPPLLDLMYLNVAHWQSSSDQRNILHVSRVPLLFGAGLSDDDIKGVEIGPNHMMYSPDPTAKLAYVEHTGAAISAGRQDLLDLKDEMGSLGLELIMSNRPGAVTATEKSIDTAQSDSALVVMSRNLETAMNNVLGFFGKWINKECGTLSINTDFHITLGDTKDAELLFKSRMDGSISVQTYWFELKRRGILHEDFDADEEEKLLEEDETPPEPINLEDDENDGQNLDEGGEGTGGTSAANSGVQGRGVAAAGN